MRVYIIVLMAMLSVGCVTTEPRSVVSSADVQGKTTKFDGVWRGSGIQASSEAHAFCNFDDIPIMLVVRDGVATGFPDSPVTDFQVVVAQDGNIEFIYDDYIITDDVFTHGNLDIHFQGALDNKKGQGRWDLYGYCSGRWKVEKTVGFIFTDEVDVSKEEVLMSKSAMDGFDQYIESGDVNYRAFAHSAAGRWGWKSSPMTHMSIVIEDALRNCKSRNSSQEETHPCEVVHVNNQWIKSSVTQPEHMLVGKTVKFLQDDSLWAGKESPKVHVKSGDHFKIAGVFTRNDGVNILILKNFQKGIVGNRTLNAVQNNHEIISKVQ